MKTHYNKYSIYLLILSVITLLLTVFMFSTLYLILDHIEEDVAVIKNTETIRGSIQRVTNLSIHSDSSSTKIISYNISKLLDNNLSDSAGFSKGILNEMDILRKNWIKLQSILVQYKQNNSKSTLKEIIKLTEACWASGDEIIQIYHIENQKLVNRFSILYLLLIINACCIILSIIIIVFFVKKNVEYFASHDSVTNVYNRTSFDNIIEYELARSQRYNHPMSIVLINIDSFSNIKDKNGNKSGDNVIKIIADLIKETLRKSDQLFRLNESELGIIVSETKYDGTIILSERLKEIINKYNFSDYNNVAVSIGTAELSKEDTSELLYNKAKTALCSISN